MDLIHEVVLILLDCGMFKDLQYIFYKPFNYWRGNCLPDVVFCQRCSKIWLTCDNISQGISEQEGQLLKVLIRDIFKSLTKR